MHGSEVVIRGAIFLQGIFPLYAVLFLLCAVAYSLYAVLFSLYSRDLVLARFETRPAAQGSQNGGHHGQEIVSCILKELSLGHLTELFHREKYSRYNFHAIYS